LRLHLKLSISHIAWPKEEEPLFFRQVSKWGCTGIEIAPNRVWPEPIDTGTYERHSFKEKANNAGLEIVSLHALLFTRKDLGLFRGIEIETKLIAYLQELCRLAADLGAHVLVFGSPANRRRANISLDEAMERAATVFSKVGRVAGEEGVCMCIEPLGKSETDFITTGLEGLRLVEMTASPGFGLHLDAKSLSEEDGDYTETVRKTAGIARHFHVSEPDLAAIGSSKLVDHETMGKLLAEYGYNGYASIEMRTQPNHLNVIKNSIDLAKKWYIERNESRHVT